MNEDAAREDIAFIRRNIEQGREAAGTWSADILVWGVAIAAAYVGTYARIRGLWTVNPPWLWVACIALPWLYSLRRVWLRVAGVRSSLACSPVATTLWSLWLGCGITLSILGLTAIAVGARNDWWMSPVVAGVVGLCFFVSSSLCNLAWMRWVAVAWWAGSLALVVWRGAESLLLMAALMLVLFALPGIVLMRRRSLAGAA